MIEAARIEGPTLECLRTRSSHLQLPRESEASKRLLLTTAHTVATGSKGQQLVELEVMFGEGRASN